MGIERAPAAASHRDYDLIVIGAGIYGAMIALEATRRGCSVLLLEKDDFGGATSYNSLRIIHGGLRDLQTLGFRRYWQFGKERRWFLDHFPHLVERLPVLVPLYQRGIMRTEVFRLAFWLDRLLLPRRDRTGEEGRSIPPGRVLSPAEVKQRFPAVDEHGLAGGALWYDACVPDSQRLVVDVIRAVCERGATALNYMPAVDLLTDAGTVTGVRAEDAQDGTSYRFRADTVVNAAGPWCREVARRFENEVSALYDCSIAWNVLFDREAPAECGLGVTPPESGTQIYFVHPWKDRLLIGTGHRPRAGVEGRPRPSDAELADFLDNVNRALPHLDLAHVDILHVYAGYLPAKGGGTTDFVKTDRWVDHSTRGGPSGLFSIQGTKFTAARATAEKGIARIFPDRKADEEWSLLHEGRVEAGAPRGVFDFHWEPDTDEGGRLELLDHIVNEEAVIHLDDLILRRTSLGDNPRRALRLAPQLCQLFDWSQERCEDEVRRVEEHFSWARRSSPSTDELV